MFIGISNAISGIRSAGLSYIKDNLKLYLDFKSTKSDTLKFPCDGSTSFDGSNDYIDCGADVHDFSSGDFTVSAWVYHDRESNHGGIFGIRGSNTELQIYLLDSNAKIASYNGSTAVNSDSAVPENTWTHIVVVQDGSNKRFYINGIADGSSSQANGTADSATFKIGYTGNGSEYFKGKIANAGVWSRILSPEEINSVMRKNYSQLGSVEKTSLVSWWALDDVYLGSTTNASDDNQSVYDTAKIMEDKNGSVGSNLVPDGEFESGVDNWTVVNGTISLNSDGNMLITGVGGTASARLNALTLEVNTFYLLEVGIAGGSDTSINIRYDDEAYGDTKYGGVYSNASQGTNASPKNVSSNFTSDSSNTGFYLNIGQVGDGETAIISHVKLYKVTSGNYGSIFGATTTTSVYGGNAPVLPRSVDVAREGEAEKIGNGSALFDGTDDYIAIPDNDLLSMNGDHKFSICAWINMDDATNFTILGKGVYNTDAEYLFWVNGSDKLSLEVYDESVADTYEQAYYNTALTSYEGSWVHVAGTYNGVGGTSANAGMKLYVNGINVATTLADSGTYVAMENLAGEGRIGRYDSSYADGNISQVGIWKGELTQAQVQAHMESTSYDKIPASVKSTLGSEVASNNFSGWTLNSWTDNGDGTATINNTSGTTKDLTLSHSFTGTRVYKISVTFANISGTMGLSMADTGGIDKTVTTNGEQVVYIRTPDAGAGTFFIRSNNSSSATISNVSIKGVTNDLVGYWGLDASGYGDDLTNGVGTMESGSGWSKFSSSPTIAYSTSKFYQGTQSIHITGASNNHGIQLTNQFSIVSGEQFYVDAWVYVVGGAYISMGISGTTDGLFKEFTPTADTWVNLTHTYVANTTGNTYIGFFARDGNSEFYVDNVTVKRVVALDSTDNNNHGSLI